MVLIIEQRFCLAREILKEVRYFADLLKRSVACQQVSRLILLRCANADSQSS